MDRAGRFFTGSNGSSENCAGADASPLSAAQGGEVHALLPPLSLVEDISVSAFCVRALVLTSICVRGCASRPAQCKAQRTLGRSCCDLRRIGEIKKKKKKRHSGRSEGEREEEKGAGEKG